MKNTTSKSKPKSSDNIIRFHMIMTILWALLAIPSVLWWHDSILWVIFVSLYANCSTEFGAWSAAKAAKSSKEANE